MAKAFFLAVGVLSLFLVMEIAFGEIPIGVKEGDSIEYTVSTTGVPAQGHNVVWASMEILSIQGYEITVNTTTKAVNGIFSSVVMKLNPEKGEVDVWAIIPGNLSKGETFFDKNLGNIAIQGEEPKEYSGVTRDTIFYNSTTRFKRWDKATGVFLEGSDILANYSLTAVFYKTNMWSNKILGLDPVVFFLTSGFVVVSVAFASVLVMKRIRTIGKTDKTG